jgi:aspartate aminotransferase-like enzyme
MIRPGLFEYKIATEDWEYEQIYEMNYRTFVEEVGQHQPNLPHILVDKFNKDNTYIICLDKKKLLGMVSVSGKRPFSLDEKLHNLDSYMPLGRSICEIRLLAVKRACRYSRVLRDLLAKTIRYCHDAGYNLAIISGLLRQQKLYRHMGFVPFGPVVGTGEAVFQPMYLTTEELAQSRSVLAKRISEIDSTRRINLMPGPVEIAPVVQIAFNDLAISHRSQEFLKIHKQTKQLLCRLVNAKHVEILMGSGTLANDVIAGQLSLVKGGGIVLSNGEFGDRLIDCAGRLGLTFDTYSMEWGRMFGPDDIKSIIDLSSGVKWLWAVHCETSTGMLNDLETLKNICREKGILLCVDCVSSIGSAHVDLEGVYLASGVSGKGLCSYSGLCMVFYNSGPVQSDKRLPAYTDLGTYSRKHGVPFTVNSNLINALHESLGRLDIDNRLRQISILSDWLRKQLRDMGLKIIVEDKSACSSVITINLPRRFSSEVVGRKLELEGYFTSYRSEYLLKRNWIQICPMSCLSKTDLEPLLVILRKLSFKQRF